MNDSRIYNEAKILNDDLLTLVCKTKYNVLETENSNENENKDGENEEQKEENTNTNENKTQYNVSRVIDVIIEILQREECKRCRGAAFKWIAKLLIDLPLNIIPVQSLLRVCFTRLKDNDDNIVDVDLEVLARISLDKQYLDQVLCFFLFFFCV